MTDRTKKIVFVTATRADFGKLKSLILTTQDLFDVHVFVTGMHMIGLFGHTYREVEKAGIRNIHTFINQSINDTMDVMLAKAVQGFSDYVKEAKPDLIIVHGDRVEALATAIVGSLNNILVGHIEGGELSGTIDGSIRHAISKLSHLHFAANEGAKKRLRQLGEGESQIFVIGSPDLDAMRSDNLPSLGEAKTRYQINFDRYGLGIFHPVTTEYDLIEVQVEAMMQALCRVEEDIIFIFPNNDLGSKTILDVYDRYKNNERFRFFPSIRFEYFLTFLKNARFIVGNSSAGVREAPFYGVPSIDVGTRQSARVKGAKSVTHVPVQTSSIIEAVIQNAGKTFAENRSFGDGNSAKNFLSALCKREFWLIDRQKTFVDLDIV